MLSLASLPNRKLRRHRMPAEHVYYYRSPNHHGNHVLSFSFAFDKEEDVYQFAFCYPYSFSRLQRYLELEEQKQLAHMKREQLGETVQERSIELVTISNDLSKTGIDIKRKYVIVTARVHAGETPSSFVCQGLINFLIGDNPVARTLRDYIIFKIVPMLNPDGVFVGNYRTALLGSDLNRCWQNPSPLAQPDIYLVKSLVENLISDNEAEVDMYLDLHAHSGLLGTFVYGNSYDDVYRQERHALFPKHLSYFAEDFSLQNTVYNRDPGKSGTSRRFFSSLENDKINCYTVEVSFFGYPSKSGNQVIPYTEESYLRLGENLARAILDYYTAIGHIPANAAGGSRKGGPGAKGGRGRGPARAPAAGKEGASARGTTPSAAGRGTRTGGTQAAKGKK